MKHDTIVGSIPKEVITYAAGSIEARISQIARDSNQPESELREWVAIFLLSSWTGISNYMSPLRRETAKTYPSAREMALANNSHSQPQKKPSNSQNKVTLTSKRGKRFQMRTQKGYKYNGTHWMQLPKNRKRVLEMARQRAAKRANKKNSIKKKGQKHDH